MRSNLRRKEQRRIKNRRENLFYISYTCSAGKSHGHHTTKKNFTGLIRVYTLFRGEAPVRRGYHNSLCTDFYAPLWGNNG